MVIKNYFQNIIIFIYIHYSLCDNNKNTTNTTIISKHTNNCRNTYTYINKDEVEYSKCDSEFDNPFFTITKNYNKTYSYKFKLPPNYCRARWVDVPNGETFDKFQKSTPDEIRPPGVILFWGYKQCPNAAERLNFNIISEKFLPSIERLTIYKYDMDAAPFRYPKFTPEMDLQTRFKVKECPTIVFVPRSCDGSTIWCTKKVRHYKLGNITQVGCNNFIESCNNTKQFVFKSEKDWTKNWIDWVLREITKAGEPKVSKSLFTYKNQGRWLTMKQMDNVYHYPPMIVKEVVPKFTDLGFLGTETPNELQNYFIQFFKDNINKTKFESQPSTYSTINQYEVDLKFIQFNPTDELHEKHKKMFNDHVLPILKSWSGIPDLELTSIYGLRLYYPGSFLAHHMDRPKTHIISVTFCIAKLDVETLEIVDVDSIAEEDEWPIEIYTHDGDIFRYPHKPGTMVLYESSVLFHGRPYKSKKYIHLGVFLHYKPKHYEEIIDRLENLESELLKHNRLDYDYISRESKEPQYPVYSYLPYGKLIEDADVVR